MILHDICTLKFIRTDSGGDVVETEDVENIPVEFAPVNSDIEAAEGLVNTRYRGILSADIDELASSISFVPNRMEVWFLGNRLQLDAGFERHRVLGRHHHVEFVVRDFGRFGYNAS